MSLRERLRAAVAQGGIVGAVAGVLVAGERETTAAGLADVERGTPMTPTTRLPVASLTKPMVATAAVRRWQHTALPLDTPLVELLPELAPDWRASRRIGLHHLLSHTSGLRVDIPPPYPDRLADAVRETVQHGQTYRLGAAWRYCNAGFALAGYALGQRHGDGFEAAMAADLFDPAGLAATGFDPADAVGHTDGAPVRASYAVARRPGGGVVSTVDDVLTFAGFALADPSFAATGRAVTPTQFGSRYGLGWNLAHGGRVRWHTGDWGGCHSALVLLPERRAAVAVVVNDDAGTALREDLAWRELHRATGVRRPRVAPALWFAAATARSLAAAATPRSLLARGLR